ncbi:MAG TPA: hypothetical protein PLO50_00895 [Nitrospira sp.]|nr:hypothetical protein [Nitrospira sp.]
MAEIRLPYNYDPRSYQLKCWTHFAQNKDGLRGAAVWHRRAGKDLLGINLVAIKHLQRVGMYWHLLPTYKQGRAIVWNGFTKEGRRFIDHFPNELVTERNKTEMRITFTNGAMYQVIGTDDINSLVGTNPVGCIFSEYSLQDPGAWDYIRPILAENGGWALFIYTARGKNHGYKMYNMALKNPKWFCELLKAGNEGTKRDDGTPVVSDQIIQDERDAGMPEEMIQQEFFCSFEAPLVGSYFGHQMAGVDKRGQICKVPWEPRLEVHTAWDLGIDDEMVVWFIQEMPGEVRIINHIKVSGESLVGVIKMLKGQVEGYEVMGDYMYGKHYAPHDIEVRELTSGKSRIETAKEHGVKFTTCAKHEVEDGIEAVRMLLPKCWFDAEKCERGIEALKSYRKEWDEKNKCFRSTPLHDWASHDADALRTYAWGRRADRHSRKEHQTHARDEHDYNA